MRTLTLAAALLLAAPILASAQTAQDGLAADGAYVLSANPRSGAVFLQLTNHGSRTCTVTGGSTPAAGKAELHTNVNDNGVMKMTPIAGGIAIPAGGTHALTRGGDHMMLMGLTQPLAPGDTIALTLTGDCGDLVLDAVPVVDPKAVPAPAAPMDHGAAAPSH